MVLAQVYSSESGSGTDKEQATAVEVKASGMLEEVQLGVSGKVEHKSGSKFASSQGDERAYYDSVGGTMSRGGGWSLGHGEEVPLLLDLRPIHELLNPVLFDNPAVWLGLRANMQAEFELLSRYHQLVAQRAGARDRSDAERILATAMGVLYDADVYP